MAGQSDLIYSSGYYRQPDDDLEDAQTQQLEYLCRKLQLKAGDRLLDVGCGWGGFALYAAQMYGAIVHGITLSRRQAEVANQRLPPWVFHDVAGSKSVTFATCRARRSTTRS